jgi:PIN domain
MRSHLAAPNAVPPKQTSRPQRFEKAANHCRKYCRAPCRTCPLTPARRCARADPLGGPVTKGHGTAGANTSTDRFSVAKIGRAHARQKIIHPSHVVRDTFRTPGLRFIPEAQEVSRQDRPVYDRIFWTVATNCNVIRSSTLAEGPPIMIVVFDTNIWKSALYLQSPMAAAARFFLRNQQAKVALPEVVRLEVERHFGLDIRKSISSIKDHHARLLAAFGTLKEIVLPDEGQIESVAAQVFESVGVEVVNVPFSIQSARASFLRTIDKTPPSDKTQEFKDGVIWADCIHLLKDDNVFLVTSDRAFYEEHDYGKGLSRVLKSEIADVAQKFTLLPKLGDLLDQVKTRVELDMGLLAEKVIDHRRDEIVILLAENGFTLGNVAKVERRLYATETSQLLFLEFTAEYECPAASETNRPPAVLIISGDGVYNTDKQSFSQLRSSGEVLRFILEDGTEKEHRTINLSAEMHLGHREIVNKIRYQLD